MTNEELLTRLRQEIAALQHGEPNDETVRLRTELAEIKKRAEDIRTWCTLHGHSGDCAAYLLGERDHLERR